MQGIDVRIYSVINGYVIEDLDNGGTYVAGKLDSYTMLDGTVLSVLRELERKAQESQESQDNITKEAE